MYSKQVVDRRTLVVLHFELLMQFLHQNVTSFVIRTADRQVINVGSDIPLLTVPTSRPKARVCGGSRKTYFL